MTRITELPPRVDETPYPDPRGDGPDHSPWPDWAFDNRCAQLFADRMMVKLAAARQKGRGGWWDKTRVTQDELTNMLVEHIFKGDPVDVANFCMFLHARGERIARNSIDEAVDAAPDQPDVIAAQKRAATETSAQVDASLGLVELPPIRVSNDMHLLLQLGAKVRGLALQAHVRRLIDLGMSAVNDPDSPGVAVSTLVHNISLDEIGDALAKRVTKVHVENALAATAAGRITDLEREKAELESKLADAQARIDATAKREQQALKDAGRWRSELASLLRSIEAGSRAVTRAEALVSQGLGETAMDKIARGLKTQMRS